MKCEMIRDLLPLYIDGLTSTVSNQEIETHLKSCEECNTYYQEMTGELKEGVSISDEEIEDIGLIKKIEKKRKTKIAAIIAGAVAAVFIVFALMLPLVSFPVAYKDVTLSFGVDGAKVYFHMESKGMYELYFSGRSEDNQMNLKVLGELKLGNYESVQGWEDEIGTEEDPCRWTIEFKDRIIVIENGVLIDEIIK